MEKDISFLQETDLFKNFSAAQTAQVLKICRKVHCSENDVIMREGEEGDRMYIIMAGSVEVIRRLTLDCVDDESAEKSKVFTRLDADRHPVFGEIALLAEFKRTATVRALTDCTLYEINRKDFLSLAEADYEFGYRILLNLAGILSARLKKADEETIKLTTVLSMILKET